jgi:hypothetical protein
MIRVKRAFKAVLPFSPGRRPFPCELLSIKGIYT